MMIRESAMLILCMGALVMQYLVVVVGPTYLVAHLGEAVVPWRLFFPLGAHAGFDPPLRLFWCSFVSRLDYSRDFAVCVVTFHFFSR